MQKVKDEQLKLRYKVCFAKITDFKKQFMKASFRYYELSQCLQSEDDRQDALHTSVVCAVLTAAGPQRSRMLATLYKDERSARLDIYPILEKM